MAGADSIYTELTQDLQLTFQGTNVDCRAERTKVVMIANPVELNVLAIQEKSLVDREFNLPYAARCFVMIYHAAVLPDRGNDQITARIIEAPQFRRAHCGLRIDSGRFARTDGYMLSLGDSNGFSPTAVSLEFKHFMT